MLHWHRYVCEQSKATARYTIYKIYSSTDTHSTATLISSLSSTVITYHLPLLLERYRITATIGILDRFKVVQTHAKLNPKAHSLNLSIFQTSPSSSLLLSPSASLPTSQPSSPPLPHHSPSRPVHHSLWRRACLLWRVRSRGCVRVLWSVGGVL